MSSYKVKVKWGKETFSDVDLNMAELPMVFKAQLFAMTGVQPHRQKIMVKGATVKDDSWEGVKCKDGSLVFMMGSKDEDVLEEPVVKTKFIEDMTEDEMNCAMELPVGIKNLGNTCYLNAVVQCLKTVPELHEAIKQYKFKSDDPQLPRAMVVAAIQDVFRFMDMGKTSIPIVFVDLFRSTFPRFAEMGEGGKYMQQDASECWIELVRLLQDCLKAKEDGQIKGYKSLIDQYFGGTTCCVWKCEESEEEEPQETTDRFQQLSCHISQEVKYLHTGLVARMKEQITKYSQKLGRDALFTKTSSITRLPAYLSIEMVRFFYKEKEGVNAKILKDVKFPLVLDVFDLCAPDLKTKLSLQRQKYREMDGRLAEEEKNIKRGLIVPKDEKNKKLVSYPFSFADDPGSNNCGFYQLQAVLTHQGRSSSSGHYVSWVRFRGKDWLKCDDEDVSAVTEEDVLKLSGGGDWHTAYILLYGPRILELEENDEPKTEISEEASNEKMEVTS